MAEKFRTVQGSELSPKQVQQLRKLQTAYFMEVLKVKKRPKAEQKRMLAVDLPDFLRSSPDSTITAFRVREMVGYVEYHLTGGGLYLVVMHVKPECRNKGIARKLVSAARALAEKSNLKPPKMEWIRRKQYRTREGKTVSHPMPMPRSRRKGR